MQTRATIDSVIGGLTASPAFVAERVGFEPTNTVRCYTLSRRAPSTARPPLHSGRKGTGGRPSYQIGSVQGGDCSRRTPLLLRFAPDRCSSSATSNPARRPAQTAPILSLPLRAPHPRPKHLLA